MHLTVVLEKTLESPLDCKEIKPLNPKGNQSWIFIGRTDAEAQAPILWPPDVKSRLWKRALPEHQKRPWCWERLRVRGKGSDRGWDGWMTSLTQWIWVWTNSRRQWRTEKPSMLQPMGLQSWTLFNDWTTSTIFVLFIFDYLNQMWISLSKAL